MTMGVVELAWLKINMNPLRLDGAAPLIASPSCATPPKCKNHLSGQIAITFKNNGAILKSFGFYNVSKLFCPVYDTHTHIYDTMPVICKYFLWCSWTICERHRLSVTKTDSIGKKQSVLLLISIKQIYATSQIIYWVRLKYFLDLSEGGGLDLHIIIRLITCPVTGSRGDMQLLCNDLWCNLLRLLHKGLHALKMIINIFQ